jgi:hypothetical protein
MDWQSDLASFATYSLPESTIDTISTYLRETHKTDICFVVKTLLHRHHLRVEAVQLAKNGVELVKLIAEHPRSDHNGLNAWAYHQVICTGSKIIKNLAAKAKDNKSRTNATCISLKVAESWNINDHFGQPMHARARQL